MRSEVFVSVEQSHSVSQGIPLLGDTPDGGRKGVAYREKHFVHSLRLILKINKKMIYLSISFSLLAIFRMIKVAVLILWPCAGYLSW